MAIAVKVDEDLPGTVAEAIRKAGYDAATVHQQGMAGYPDDRLWEAVQAEGRLLVTADKGFADLRLHPPGAHSRVVLMRLPQESRRAYVALTMQLLAAIDLARLVGCVCVVTPDRLRVSRP